MTDERDPTISFTEAGINGGNRTWFDEGREVNRFMALDDDALTISLERSPRRIAEQPDRTFSEEAVREIYAKMWEWLSGRLLRHWNVTGEPPHRLRMMIAIGINDDAEKFEFEVHEEVVVDDR